MGSNKPAGEESTRRAWGSLLAIAAALTAIGGLVFFASAGAQDSDLPDEANHVTVLRNDGRFTGPGEWPPAPQTATTPLVGETVDPADESAPLGRNAARSDRTVEAELLALRPEIAAELGDRYSLLSALHPAAPTATDKLAVATDVTEITWFSRSMNQTVRVTVKANAVTDIATIPAGEAQQQLSAEEHDLAVALAADHWRGEIGSDIDDLIGFSIFGLREDGSINDVRMAYVSFHDGPRALPELLTWVDLTNEQVVDARVDR